MARGLGSHWSLLVPCIGPVGVANVFSVQCSVFSVQCHLKGARGLPRGCVYVLLHQSFLQPGLAQGAKAEKPRDQGLSVRGAVHLLNLKVWSRDGSSLVTGAVSRAWRIFG